MWANDHSPPHVHVFSERAEAKIELGDAAGHPRLVENCRMRRSDLAAALRAVSENREFLLRKWREIHGRLGPH
jgi:hypothetical protein